MICRHFVASLSEDAAFDHAALRVTLGRRPFCGTATRCVRRGWYAPLEVPPYPPGGPQAAEAEGTFAAAAAVRAGAVLPLARPPASEQQWTAPPPHLSESELLSLMEAHASHRIA
jgi:DNA topoisomerase IA